MSIEQSLNTNSQEKIINKEVVSNENTVEVVSEEDKQAKIEEKNQKEKENNEKIEKVKENLMKQFEGQESKEEFPEGHILNSKTLEKIAQLEAIDWNTLEFNQTRYDEYMSEQEGFGSYSVPGNQKVLKESMALGRSLQRSLGKTNPIYGKGGLNRYGIDYDTGTIKLLRGTSNTSGSTEYKAKLAQKAKELGIKVEGQ